MSNIDKDILMKRFQTTMIGALYVFEENFGYLWGLDKDDDELTDKEIQFKNIWEETRNKILNNGNNQFRKCVADLEKNNTIKYNYKFKNK